MKMDASSHDSSPASLIVAPPIGTSAGPGKLLGPRPELPSLPVGEIPEPETSGVSSRRHTVSSMLVHLPLCPALAVLEMLSEVIGSKEFFGLVALSKFMHVGEMVYSTIPVRLR